eukprot:scaffold328_cov130-Cylindrotheca_fusiformis.AAC.23
MEDRNAMNDNDEESRLPSSNDPTNNSSMMDVDPVNNDRQREPDPSAFFVYTASTKIADIPKSTIAHLLVDASVKEIPDKAFKNCPKLMAAQLPETLNKIGDYAFEQCLNLKSVQFYSNDSPSKIPPHSMAPTDLEADGSIIFPESTSNLEIGDFAFLFCKKLKELKIGSPNMIVGNYVFSKTGLVHVDLPQGLRVIGTGWFAGCGSLVSAPIPSSVVEIGDSAFGTCNRLAEVNFPYGLKSIGYRAFDWCESIQLCIIPSTVTTIGERAFDNCSSLKQVVLPCTLEIIEEGVFEDCEMLRNVELPNTLREIKRWSFSGCRSLTHMRVPPNVNQIEVSAFDDCANMVSLELPEGLESAHRWDGSDEEREMRGLRVYQPEDTFGISGCSNLVNLLLPPQQVVRDFGWGSFVRKLKFGAVVEGYDDLVFRLKHRFDGCPLHELCYYHSYHPLAETMGKLKILLEADPLGATAKLDAFGMTPLHILALTEKPDPSLLRALIDAGRKDDVIDAKDLFLQSPLDYLCCNSSPNFTPHLLRDVISRTTVDRVQRLGLVRWREEISRVLDQALVVDWSSRKEKVRSVFLKLEELERCEIAALLEQALWKTAIDHAGSAVVDRQNCLLHCGASVVIPNVLPFLGKTDLEVRMET